LICAHCDTRPAGDQHRRANGKRRCRVASHENRPRTGKRLRPNITASLQGHCLCSHARERASTGPASWARRGSTAPRVPPRCPPRPFCAHPGSGLRPWRRRPARLVRGEARLRDQYGHVVLPTGGAAVFDSGFGTKGVAGPFMPPVRISDRALLRPRRAFTAAGRRTCRSSQARPISGRRGTSACAAPRIRA